MLEGQNDDQLDGLHQKLKALHAVTRDIHDDSRGQNTMLDGTVRHGRRMTGSLSARRANRSTRSARRSRAPPTALGAQSARVRARYAGER